MPDYSPTLEQLDADSRERRDVRAGDWYFSGDGNGGGEWWLDGAPAPAYVQDRGPLTPLPPPWDPDRDWRQDVGSVGYGTGADDPWLAAARPLLVSDSSDERRETVRDGGQTVRPYGDDVRGGPGSLFGIRLPSLPSFLWLVLLVALVLTGLWLSSKL